MKKTQNKKQASNKLTLKKWQITKITKLTAIKGGGNGSGGVGCPTKPLS
ncbi:hypothetical protein [Aquimarina pacifica]|nr:hypothetical protein [Aquimarina pacifica]